MAKGQCIDVFEITQAHARITRAQGRIERPIAFAGCTLRVRAAGTGLRAVQRKRRWDRPERRERTWAERVQQQSGNRNRPGIGLE